MTAEIEAHRVGSMTTESDRKATEAKASAEGIYVYTRNAAVNLIAHELADKGERSLVEDSETRKGFADYLMERFEASGLLTELADAKREAGR